MDVKQLAHFMIENDILNHVKNIGNKAIDYLKTETQNIKVVRGRGFMIGRTFASCSLSKSYF